MKIGNIFKKSKKATISELENVVDLFEDNMKGDFFLENVKALKNISKKFQKGKTLLHFACENYDLELAKTVIGLGIHIEEKDDYGNTALWTAVFNARGNYVLVDLLLQHNANPKATNNSNNSPIQFAEKINDEILISKLQAIANNNQMQ